MGKVTRHVEGRTKEKRVAVRKALGPLKDLTVRPRTKVRYDNARQGFYSFLRTNHLELPSKRVDLDPLVSEYIEHLWSSGEGRSKANDTVAGLQDKDPLLRGSLPSSWRLLKTWSQNEIPSRAQPLPEVVVHAMAGRALMKNDLSFALSLLIGFYSMLRTGELLGVSSQHISLGGSSQVAVISLGFTKGGQRQGALESCTLGVVDVLQLLQKWKKKNSPNTPLCPAPHKWRALFSESLRALGLEEFGFRPYSLRRGGATHWFRRHGSFDKLMIQGRWAAQKTAKIYINEGLAVLAETKVPMASLKPFVTAYRNAIR